MMYMMLYYVKLRLTHDSVLSIVWFWSLCVCDVFAVFPANWRRDTTSQPYQSWSSWRRMVRWSQTKAESRSGTRVWRVSGAGWRWPRSSRTLKAENHMELPTNSQGLKPTFYLQKRARIFLCNCVQELVKKELVKSYLMQFYYYFSIIW